MKMFRDILGERYLPFHNANPAWVKALPTLPIMVRPNGPLLTGGKLDWSMNTLFQNKQLRSPRTCILRPHHP